MTPVTTPHVTNADRERAPYQAPRLVVHGSVASLTEAQPSSPSVGSTLVDAEIVFLGPNA
ncbi:MAG: lasso RiPP family leader peptide-containing protein [Acidobacteria bacterium]|nr:lasso RiPP family leader peptide-containing protein [Acidobacteriota bacterium]